MASPVHLYLILPSSHFSYTPLHNLTHSKKSSHLAIFNVPYHSIIIALCNKKNLVAITKGAHLPVIAPANNIDHKSTKNLPGSSAI